MHGGGVAGAISRKGGHVIDDESEDWVNEHGPVPTGQTGYTNKGNLGCKKYWIHAVGPVWRSSKAEECDELLASAIKNSFKRAEELECESIAMPAISSGIFGYPLDRCTAIFPKSTKEYIDSLESIKNLKTIVMCNIESATVGKIREAFETVFLDDAEEEVREDRKEEIDEPTKQSSKEPVELKKEAEHNSEVEIKAKNEDSKAEEQNEGDLDGQLDDLDIQSSLQSNKPTL